MLRQKKNCFEKVVLVSIFERRCFDFIGSFFISLFPSEESLHVRETSLNSFLLWMHLSYLSVPWNNSRPVLLNTVYMVSFFFFIKKMKPHPQLSCLKTTLNLSLELAHHGKRAPGYGITSRLHFICVGFLKFTMGNLMPFPPIHKHMSDHTLK